jgi:hypothetical protein
MVAMRGVLLLPAVVAGLLLSGCGASRGDNVARNETIAAVLPVFPGAVKMHEFSTPNYSGGEFADPTSYTTQVVYRVPPGTRRIAILRFYRSRLRRRGWQSRAETGTTRRIARSFANFARDRALLLVNTLLLSSAEPYPVWKYEIEVDSRGGPDD